MNPGSIWIYRSYPTTDPLVRVAYKTVHRVYFIWLTDPEQKRYSVDIETFLDAFKPASTFKQKLKELL